MHDAQRVQPEGREGQDASQVEGVVRKHRQSTKGLSAEEKRIRHNRIKKEWRDKNKEKINARARSNRARDPERFKSYGRKAYHKRTPTQRAEIRAKNRDRHREWQAGYYARNRAKCIASQTKYILGRRKVDTAFRLRQKLSTRINIAVQNGYGKKAASTMELIGCTVQELIRHLESQFLPGMTWQNHTYRGWHIDHKRPCASFDLSNADQQRLCFHYTNLRPMWGVDNIRKADKICL